MKFPGRGTSLAIAAVLAAAGLAACGSGTAATTSTGSGPELRSISIGVLDISDYVVTQIAQDKGIFRQEGFRSVRVVKIPTTATDDIDLLSHTMDIVAENYVSMFAQQEKVPGLNLRIIADLAQSTPGLFVAMVPKGSPITSLAQLKGKKYGCSSPAIGYCQLSLDVLLKPYGLSTRDLTIVTAPFARVPELLASHAIDAAFETEPFITSLEAKGDRVLQDMLTGPLAGAPQSCWGVQESFLRKYPKTVAAFQRAMSKAGALADSDPALVRSELPRFIPTLNPQLAKVIGLPTWNTTLSLARMERVAGVMEEFGVLPPNFNVRQMYVPPPAGS